MIDGNNGGGGGGGNGADDAEKRWKLKHSNSIDSCHWVYDVIFIKLCILEKGHAPICKQFDKRWMWIK